jgi:Zn-dependent protease
VETSLLIIFQIAVLLFSITIHEVSHGLAANSMGDRTAKDLGRLSLNPIRHLDIFGSLVLPFFLYLTGLPIFGYAKPVPYNPLYLKDQRWGPAKVAIAGPVSNLMLALLFGLTLRFLPDVFSSSLVPELFGVIVLINLVLAIFNLFPVPPLDGHWILFSVLPTGLNQFKNFLHQYSLFIFLALIFFGGPFIFLLVSWAFKAITGLGF